MPGKKKLTENLFAGKGEMETLMRSKDWTKTKLGAVENWPNSLKTMLGVILRNRFPMMIWWGPNLFNFYNDAYRPILRDKHPKSLGAPAAELWAEIWDFAGPLARGIMEGGPATWMEDVQLFIKSGPISEETYFTFSYSPIPGDDGKVAGLLNTVQETTVKVQSERQIRTLRDLAAKTADAKSEMESHRITLEVLSANELDVPFALLYTLDENGRETRFAGASGWKDYKEANADWPFDQVLRSSNELVVEDLSKRFKNLPQTKWNARPEQAIIMPLSRAGQLKPYAFLIAGISPHRRLDERYREFFRAAANQAMNVIATAMAYETETKRAEVLAQLDRAKTTFFSNISHEFRTPLTLILGPIEDALAQSSASIKGDDLRTVHRNAVRLLRLVNSLLDFARIEANRIQMTFAPTDLGALTNDLANSFRSLTERAGIKLTVDCETLPEPVYVDPAQWEKIVLNLISNAFKFTLAGEIAVTLRSRNENIELAVRDTGIGIPASEQPHIFERFHRVEGAKGRSFEGTGIGLSLVLELVKLHGGTLSVSSVENQGSTFLVSIPKGNAHLPKDRIAQDRLQRQTGKMALPYLLEASQWIHADISEAAADTPTAYRASKTSIKTPARVLIVDDNSDMREYLSKILSAHWHIDTAEDGEAALSRLRERLPDLVLSDIMMPRMDGFALLRELRSNPQTKDIPVILLSARAGEESLIEGLDTGADDYLTKPFSTKELLARVHTHLSLAYERRQWNRALEMANKELEAFSYSVSHDLRAPLRTINGFSEALFQEYSGKIDDEGKRYLNLIRNGCKRMGQLIEDLLDLSRVIRQEIKMEKTDLSVTASRIIEELKKANSERRVEFIAPDKLPVTGDPGLLRAALQNLLENAWKFTAKKKEAKIELGIIEKNGETVYFLRDNGAGFNMVHSGKLFGPFQRLHSSEDFPGTGIGLATVQRIIHRHGGRIWAQGTINEGAVFYFTLGSAAAAGKI